MKLTVSTTERDDVTIVTVSGEVDVYTAPQLRSAIEERIAAGQVKFVVDLQDVGFLDSTGLGVLVGRLKTVKKVDGWLRVVCTHERILRLFVITGLDQVVPVHASVDEALAPVADDTNSEGSAAQSAADLVGAGKAGAATSATPKTGAAKASSAKGGTAKAGAAKAGTTKAAPSRTA